MVVRMYGGAATAAMHVNIPGASSEALRARIRVFAGYCSTMRTFVTSSHVQGSSFQSLPSSR